jgi:hypothetical protein
MQLGRFAGPIHTIILIVDCLFYLFLEWWMPREDIDFVRSHWEQKRFVEVCVLYFLMSGLGTHLRFSEKLVARDQDREGMNPTPEDG